MFGNFYEKLVGVKYVAFVRELQLLGSFAKFR